jgi:hypothetical protein
MQIEINIKDETLAEIIIDGKRLELTTIESGYKLAGMSVEEGDSTLGGILARAIYAKIGDAMEYAPEFPAWMVLPDQLATEIYEKIA